MIETKGSFVASALLFIQKARVAAQVRETHLEKKGKSCDLTKEVLAKAQIFEDWLNAQLEAIVKKHPAYGWFSQVKGVGDLNIGKIVSQIDIEEASMISKLWRYAGMAPDAEGRAERPQKGEKLHYNKTLKSMCWRLAKSLIKAKGHYYKYYLEQKETYKKRFGEEGKKIISATELPKDKHGRRVETDEFFALGHLDTMAMRKMIKLFLSHLWLKWREAEGLPVTKPYVHAIKGHSDYRPPEDFIEPRPVEAQL